MNYGELVLSAWVLDKHGLAKPLAQDETSQELASNNLTWVHLDASHPNASRWLEREAKYLEPIILEALLSEETRPRILEAEHGVLINLRGINHNEGQDIEDMVSVRVWIDSSRIITLERRHSKATQQIEQQYMANKGPKTQGDFVVLLVHLLMEGMDPILLQLDNFIDETEEEIIDNSTQSFKPSIMRCRKQAIVFRRYLSPQREVIAKLRQLNYKWLKAKHMSLLQESFDKIQRHIEEFEMIRDRAQILKDEIANTMANKLNENLFILSLLAAIFLPLSFVTGLFGMNIAGLPGATNPSAFLIFNGALACIVVVQVIIFKLLKWF